MRVRERERARAVARGQRVSVCACVHVHVPFRVRVCARELCSARAVRVHVCVCVQESAGTRGQCAFAHAGKLRVKLVAILCIFRTGFHSTYHLLSASSSVLSTRDRVRGPVRSTRVS